MDKNILIGVIVIGVLLLALYISYTYRKGTAQKHGLSPDNSMGTIAGGVSGFALAKKYPFLGGFVLFLLGVALVFMGTPYAGAGVIVFILTVGALNLLARIVPSFNKQSFISQFIAIGAILVMCGLFLLELSMPH